MADKQFDISPQDRRLFEEKQKQRLQLREYYFKHITNPYRHMTGEGGVLDDMGVTRYMAMRHTQIEHFKTTPVSGLYAIGLFLLPMSIYGYVIYCDRMKKENLFRTGQISYRDRRFKFI